MSTVPITSAADLERRPTTSSMGLSRHAYNVGLTCVHCGLCLPSCPTYLQTSHEADSPRGRIQLMLGLADGKFEPTASVREHLDLCLDCRGCETACPSGVVYHELIEETRANLAATQSASVQSRFMRWLFFNVFTKPTRLKLALLPARILQKIGVYRLLRKAGVFRLLPLQLQKMEQMLPPEGSLWPAALPAMTPRAKTDKPQRRAEFFAGCIGSVMYEEVNRQAVELLAASGADVTVSKSQVCCGAIHLHGGDREAARKLARQNIDAMERSENGSQDFVVSAVAGCGAMLREYDSLLADDPAYADRAKKFVERVRDVSEALVELGPPTLKRSIDQTATYHDACHLAHAQKVTAAPRKLLAMVPGLKMTPLHENEICCGAAGTYNLTQPQMSASLAERKLNNIAATGAKICVTGNVGCAMQIRSAAEARGSELRVAHPVELLHEAAFGEPDARAARQEPSPLYSGERAG
ncbi:MAG TPA: heterodisulfide reductase-related iron-sulfur binding cluster [Humisphaera sp.]|jgi:glycolate oxidase iron-sulfur subunit|nr:heterodisulfide reductase-related iron-sulfur binding cluster [Humisphaera sp.]